MLWSERTERTISWLARRMACSALSARRGELLQLGERRLIVRLAHQDRPQLVARLRVAGPLGQGERQVQARHEVVGVDLDRLAERVDRLVPVLPLAAGDPEV